MSTTPLLDSLGIGVKQGTPILDAILPEQIAPAPSVSPDPALIESTPRQLSQTPILDAILPQIEPEPQPTPDIQPEAVSPQAGTQEVTPFSKRADGTDKGLGFFGVLDRPDGSESTELSIGVTFDGKEIEIPALVPGLSRQEIDSLLSGGEITDVIVDKAIANANLRFKEGKSPFAEEGEQGELPDPNTAFPSPPPEFMSKATEALKVLKSKQETLDRPFDPLRPPKKFSNQLILDLAEKSRPSSNVIESVSFANQLEEGLSGTAFDMNAPKSGFWEQVRDIPKLWWAITKTSLAPSEQAERGEAVDKLKDLRKQIKFDVPPPERDEEGNLTLQGKVETGSDIATGIGAFMTQVLVAKKLVPTGTVLPDAVAWEMINRSQGGVPGKGAAMQGTLSAISQIPTVTNAGKAAKVVASGVAFGGLTFAEGGSFEEIAISTAIGMGFAGWEIKKQNAWLKEFEQHLRLAEKAKVQSGVSEANKAASQTYQENINKGMGAREAKIILQRSTLNNARAGTTELRKSTVSIKKAMDVVARKLKRGKLEGREPELAQQIVEKGLTPEAVAEVAKIKLPPKGDVAKFEKARQKALKLVASGDPKKVKIGNAQLNFLESRRAQILPQEKTGVIKTVTEAVEARLPAGQQPSKAVVAKPSAPSKAVVPKAPVGKPLVSTPILDEIGVTTPPQGKVAPKVGTKAFAKQKKASIETAKADTQKLTKLKREEFIAEKVPSSGSQDKVFPSLYIGNVTEGMKKRIGEAWGKEPKNIKGFIEGAFPTKRTPIGVTRQEAIQTHNELKQVILDRLEVKGHIYKKDVIGGKLIEINNPVQLTPEQLKQRGLKHVGSFTGMRTENDLALAQAFWGNITSIRNSLGLAKAASPIEVIRPKKGLVKEIPTAKSRIKAVTQPSSLFESGLTSLQVLKATMKKAEIASAKGFLEGAKQVVATHKDLARFANEKMKALDITEGERKRLMGFVASNRTPLQKAHAIASIEMLAEKVEKRTALNELKAKVKETKKKIGKTMQEGGIRPEFASKLNTLIDSFTTTKISQWRIKDIGSLKAHLESIKEGITNNLDYDAKYKADLAESLIPASRLAHLDKLTKSSIHLLSPDDIRAIATEIERLVYLSDTKNRLILSRRAREEGQRLNTIMEEQKDVKSDAKLPTSDKLDASIQKSGVHREFWRHVIGIKNADVKTLVMAIEGGKEGAVAEVLNDFFRDGRNKKWKHVQSVADIIDKRLKERGITDKDLALYSPNFQRIFRGEKGQHLRGLFDVDAKPHKVKIDGQERSLNMDELASIFMHAQSDFNRNGMFNEGVANTERLIGKLKPEELADIVNIVEGDKTAKAMTDIFTEIAEGINKNAINKVSRNLKGIDIADVLNYYTVERLKLGGVAGNQQYRISFLELESFLRERTGSKNPIVIRPLTTVLGATIEGVSEYVGMAEPLRQAKNILNYRPWQKAVDSKGHSAQRRMVDTLIERVEDKGITGEEQKIAGGILKNLPRAVLVDPGIFLGQLFSEILYVNTDIPAKYLARRPIPSDANVQRMMKNWAWAWGRRHIGAASIEARDITKSDAMIRLFTGNQSFKNLAISPLSAIDIKAVTFGWLSAEDWVKDTTKLTPGTDEFYAEVNKRAHKAVSESQPMFEPENRSVLTSSKSPLFRSLVMFRSFIDQPIRQAGRARTKFRNGKIGRDEFNRQLGVIFAQFAAYTLMRQLVDFLIFGKKRSPYQILKEVATSPIRAMTFIGFAAQRQANRMIDIITGHKPKTKFFDSGLEGIVGKFVNETWNHFEEFTEGASYMGSGKRFKDGKLKSVVLMERGTVGLSIKFAQLLGVPTPLLQKIKRRFAPKKKGSVPTGVSG